MDLGLKNKKALILGSSRGLGFGIANALAAEGVHVAITGRDESTISQLTAQLRARHNTPAFALTMDFTERNWSTQLFERCIEALKEIDILVLNSGGPPLAAAQDVSTEQWHSHFSSMVIEQTQLANLCIPSMKNKAWGRILSVASSGVIQPIPNLVLSNALRSALVAWSKTLSNEVARDGITVNCLLPGKILTERLQTLNQARASAENTSLNTIEQDNLKNIPIGRYGRVEEFASAAAFLLSEQASYITGSCIRVDGGMITSI